MRERHNISASFETDGQPKLLEHNIHVLLFQAVRELLVNVAKHAKARNVIVRSHRVRDEVRIIVEDDGVGFDASSIGPEGSDMSGYGLFSIRERLGHIGGYLDVKSKPGQGTCVTLAVAIDHPKKKSGGKKQ
jgi:signal transduction histidine kinase